ncbi:MAG: pyruvate kinase [Candidatus Moranbacteria bacterium]|nr:pyruvate kinase [Candidatus Moranbacteria bacterium]
MRRTKIVATIGPTSEKVEVLSAMIKAGLNVCRLNFSHGDQRWHQNAIKKICKASKLAGKRVGIMADIQGPRIRIVNDKNLKVKKNERVLVADEHCQRMYGRKKEITLDWLGFHNFIKVGDKIFIEDGFIELRVINLKKDACIAKVIFGGIVKKHKGVNIPRISSHMGFLTEKDHQDLDFVIPLGVDFLAVSFVANRKQLINLRKIVSQNLQKEKKLYRSKNIHRHKNNSKLAYPWIISKIEKKEAVRNIDGIIEESDAIMVARGDLAIELPQEDVIITQKMIIEKCIKARKPVIVATQMMASMEEKARPTRAEISDITNAVVDGADAVMFSAETTVGAFPVRVIETADKIIRKAEESSFNDRPMKRMGRFTRTILKMRRVSKTNRVRRVEIENLQEALGLATLRQEDFAIKLKTYNKSYKRKGCLIWGTR